jgi:hypothetical protein
MGQRKRLKHQWMAADRDVEIAGRQYRYVNWIDDRTEKHLQSQMMKTQMQMQS